jgi:Domain of unknown function (DUF5666)
MRTLITTLLLTLLTLPMNALAGPHDCVNPAGHSRGWCKNGANSYGNESGGYRNNYSTISGTVIAVNGDLAQFRDDNGTTVTINQSALLNNGMGLNVGGHYTIHGYWSNNMFVAQSNGYGGYGNGYPQPGSVTSIRGVVTAIGNNRVTIMQGLFSSITINDEQALNNGTAQNLFVGRSVTAYGYWNGGTFYATSIG